MQQLFSIYRRSPKKWSELQKVALILETHVVKPARAAGTRWIDHRRKALACLATNYRSIISMFEDWSAGHREDVSATESAKMKGLLRQMKSYKFIYYMAFYQDFIDTVADLSLNFQRDNLPISEVRNSVILAQTSLHRKTQLPGPHLRSVLDSATTVDQEDGSTQSVIHYCGVTVNTDTSLTATYARQIANVMDDLITFIGQRFNSFNDEIILATEIFDPSNYPSEKDIDALLGYGVEEIQTLCNHFHELLVKKGCNILEVEREFEKVKLDIVKHHKREKFLDLWQKMLLEKDHLYQNLLHIVRIVLVMPVSTAQVERLFSCSKRIQGDWRLSLGNSTLEDLLLISTEGPDPDFFDVQPAVNRWWTSGLSSRRPYIEPYGPRHDPQSGSGSAASPIEL